MWSKSYTIYVTETDSPRSFRSRDKERRASEIQFFIIAGTSKSSTNIKKLEQVARKEKDRKLLSARILKDREELTTPRLRSGGWFTQERSSLIL